MNRDMQGRPPIPNPGPVSSDAPPSNAGGYVPPGNQGGCAPPNAGGYAPSNAERGYPLPPNMGG